jgi:hypothetical protein
MGTISTKISSEVVYVKMEPFVGEDGIYMPINEYVPEGCKTNYKMILSKEMFIDAYNKWILGDD